jgi:hypothetical protein
MTMSNQVTLEQIEQQVMQLSPQEQLKLVMHISERLSAMPLVVPMMRDEESLRRQRGKEACDAAAEMWEGTFDAAEEIRLMRWDRDEQIWPSKS